MQGARKIAAIAIAAALVFSGVSANAAGAKTKRVVAERNSPTLGHKVLTNRSGFTLYTLSAEKNGNFICKSSCLTVWIPLIVAQGVKPTGPVALGTVKRPDGRRQVTFKGRPLYTFATDSKPGDATGEGIKDVGTWHAASP